MIPEPVAVQQAVPVAVHDVNHRIQLYPPGSCFRQIFQSPEYRCQEKKYPVCYGNHMTDIGKKQIDG